MSEPVLAYQSPGAPRRWVPAVVLWLWVVANALGALFAGFWAWVCFELLGDQRSWVVVLGSFFLICAVLAGWWAFRVGWYASSVLDGEPEILAQAWRATWRSFGVLSAGVMVAVIALTAAANINREIMPLVFVVLVPYGVVAVLAMLTAMMLGRHVEMETAYTSTVGGSPEQGGPGRAEVAG